MESDCVGQGNFLSLLYKHSKFFFLHLMATFPNAGCECECSISHLSLSKHHYVSTGNKIGLMSSIDVLSL